ncbi:MAG: hypothetical protein B6U89_04235 [Desulfurococcales archaeon ex4484_58]|nr:MAG: hypothetical protein B6U89_04235 [Desulfurococcales archaeon ex4484_58]
MVYKGLTKLESIFLVIIVLLALTIIYQFSASGVSEKLITKTETKTITETVTIVETETTTSIKTEVSTTIITQTITETSVRTTTRTTAVSSFLSVEDISLYRSLSPEGTKMTITLYFTVKNIGNRSLILDSVEVPDANFTYEFGVLLYPGDSLSSTITVLENIDYSINWEIGTVHLVIFKYHLSGEIVARTISVNVTVT